jgi:hypothetical protein
LSVKWEADFDTEDPKKYAECQTVNDYAVGEDAQEIPMHDLAVPTSLSVAGTSASNAPDQTIPSQQLVDDGFPGRAHTWPV